MAIPIDEKILVVKHMNGSDRDAFVTEYIKTFSMRVTPSKIYARVANVWNRRKEYALVVEKHLRVEEEKKHRVMIPAQIKSKAPVEKRSDSLPDTGETLIKIHQLLAELVQLNKEQLALFTKTIGEKKV